MAAKADDELRRAWALLDDPEAAPVLGVGIVTQLTILSLLYYRFDEAVEWANRSLELSEDAPALRGGALAAWGVARTLAGRSEEVAQPLDALGPPEDAPPELLDAVAARGIVALWTDRLEEA